MPSERSPSICWFGPAASFHSAILASFARRRLWAGRALEGIITRRSAWAVYVIADGDVARPGFGSTMVFEWHTRVVMRSSTGSFQRSEISMALRVNS